MLFDGAEYATERDVRKAIQGQVVLANDGNERHKVAAKFGALTAIYRRDHLPTLKHSTQSLNRYLLTRYVEPRWGDTPIHEVTAKRVLNWFGELGELAATTKAAVRSVMSQCFHLAALEGFMPPDQNPMSIVRIKGTSKRQKSITILTQDQFKSLVDALPSPVNVMVFVCGVLGLRVGELLALHWEDFDFAAETVTIQRNFTRQHIGAPKTDQSQAMLPLDSALVAVLKAYRETLEGTAVLVFPSPRTGGYRSAQTLLQKGIQPAASKLKLGRVTWHTLRHSCRSWLDGEGTPVGTMKDLLRHADVSTTMNTYGRALPPEMRAAQSAMVKGLLPESMTRQTE